LAAMDTDSQACKPALCFPCRYTYMYVLFSHKQRNKLFKAILRDETKWFTRL